MPTFVDTSEAQIALKKIQKQLNKAEKRAVEEARDLIASKLKANTPVWDGKKYNGSRGNYMQEHAKDHVTYSKVKDGSAEVGYDDDVAWRVHFLEFGTVKQLPQGFVQKTQIQIEQEVIELMEKVIREALT
jgi:HK97 gp10 family phage protein